MSDVFIAATPPGNGAPMTENVAGPNVGQQNPPPAPGPTPTPTPTPTPSPTPPPAAAAQPLVTLDPSGKPTPLSYNVPEPMAYSGRNFITPQIPPEAFTTPAVDPEAVLGLVTPPATPRIANAGLVQAPIEGLTTPVSTDPGARLMGPSPVPRTRRLAEMTVGEAQQLHHAGFRPVVMTNSAGLLDVRLMPTGPSAHLPVAPGLPVNGGGGGEPPDPPDLTVAISTPAQGSTCQGTSQGVTLQVNGTWSGDALVGSPTITLSADGGTPVAVTATSSTWSATVTITSAGQHTLKVDATGKGAIYLGHQMTARASGTVTINVQLSPAPQPAPVLPTLSLTGPQPNQIVAAPNGQAAVTITGTTTITPPAPISVSVTDQTAGGTQKVDLPVGTTTFSITMQLLGLGTHQLSVVATSGGQASPDAGVPVTLSSKPPLKRILNKLMIVETLNLTSYLGAYGAGRMLKTFSLLPGEKTTISLKSYRSDTESSKQAASILDSAATEASSDFDDTVTNEQTDKNSLGQSSDFKIGATAGASWGFGSASLTASYSGAANSAREEAVKAVSTATRKHALKASTNRSVTINTETASTLTTTADDSTIREITNINVARTLNFVFRQMNQEHIVLYHLTNARVGYYTEDIPLDGTGKPQRDANNQVVVLKNYQEVTLPELDSLLAQIVIPSYTAKVRDGVLNALSGIPDYTDQLRSLVEVTTPTDSSGNPVAEASYLRVVRNLHTDFTDGSGFSVRVPGIVLAFDRIVQRTDGVYVDAILGQGDALDPYSHGLQNTAIAGKQADIAKTQLASNLVTAHDDAGATIYAKVFPPVPVIVADGQTIPSPSPATK